MRGNAGPAVSHELWQKRFQRICLPTGRLLISAPYPSVLDCRVSGTLKLSPYLYL